MPFNVRKILFCTSCSPPSQVENNRGREGLNLPAVLQPTSLHLMPIVQRMTQAPHTITEEILFYIFYSMPLDALQQQAAKLLYAKDWRFHKEHKVWITRQPNAELQKSPTSERGMYQYFDQVAWKKVPKEMTVEYDMLAPNIPIQVYGIL